MAMDKEEDLWRCLEVLNAAGTTTSRKKRKRISEAAEVLAPPVSSITNFLAQETKRLSSSHGGSGSSTTKFKGVVLQQNGHWGAQIYTNHNRVWLGTFSSEVEAAMAYDSAAIKLRNGECQRNFAWTKVTDLEPKFQNLHSQEAVLNMIKDGTYQARFLEFRIARQEAENMQKLGLASESPNSLRMQQSSKNDISQKQLFQKELTPSDVGKLNRLVIPKNYATKYFPRIDELMQRQEGGSDVINTATAPDVLLSFYDENMRPWKFRYCYWKSSQSFVFTKGWNRFVKESRLKANDTIRFYECHIKEGDGNNKDSKSFYMIKIDRAEGSGHDDVLVGNNASQCVPSALHAKQSGNECPQVHDGEDKRRITLFGVCIAC